MSEIQGAILDGIAICTWGSNPLLRADLTGLRFKVRGRSGKHTGPKRPVVLLAYRPQRPVDRMATAAKYLRSKGLRCQGVVVPAMVKKAVAGAYGSKAQMDVKSILGLRTRTSRGPVVVGRIARLNGWSATTPTTTDGKTVDPPAKQEVKKASRPGHHSSRREGKFTNRPKPTGRLVVVASPKAEDRAEAAVEWAAQLPTIWKAQAKAREDRAEAVRKLGDRKRDIQARIDILARRANQAEREGGDSTLLREMEARRRKDLAQAEAELKEVA
jgi:hypothetical protein